MNRTTARATEIRRSLERLNGMIIGISVDYKITDREVVELEKWIYQNKSLHQIEPFKQIKKIIDDILADGIIKEEEREQLLEWCISFQNNSSLDKYIKNGIGILHGILQGIAIDGEITREELSELRDWLYNYEEVKTFWPFCDVFRIVERILRDGIVDEEEKKEMLKFCSDFSENTIDSPTIHDSVYSEPYMQNRADIFKPIFSICEECEVQFPGKTFCFTGPAKTGPRADLHKKVKTIGGIPKKSIVKDLDYLVIGAQSSPCWVYSTYGRKIEQVINEKKNHKRKTKIIHEDWFLQELEKKWQ